MSNKNDKQPKEVAEIIRKSKLKNIEYYKSLSLENRFTKLILLYDEVEDWKSEYEKVERRKPPAIRTKLPSQDINDIIEAGLDDEILELALSMHTVNKIVHKCENVKDKIIKDFIISNIKNGNLPKDILSKHNLRKISKAISRIFNNANEKDRNTLQIMKMSLKLYGIDEKMLEQIDREDISVLDTMVVNGYYIKQYEMENLIEKLKNREDISYGMCYIDEKDDNVKKPTTLPIFVVDLPYYGQFSVHMKNKKSISALSNTHYDRLRIFEKESVMLTDGISEQAEEVIKRKRRNGKKTVADLIPTLRSIRKTNPRFAHYVAVKMGATKQELDKLYKEYER